MMLMRMLARTPLYSLLIAISLLTSACAQVPKESVDLSATVGRDLLVLQDSHRKSVLFLFDELRADVNEFVDEVYVPYQVRKTLEQDKADFDSGEFDITLFGAFTSAAASGASDEEVQEAWQVMHIYVEEMQREIEWYRETLLDPIDAQEREILTDIEESYARVHYANSIVTGHLQSVVKVHDAQQRIADALGVKDLRARSGAAIAEGSTEVSGLLEKARKGEEAFDDAEEFSKKLRRALE